MTIKSDLPKLAEKLLALALAEDATNDFRIDTFKAVANYHVQTVKAVKGKPVEDPDNVTFAQLTKSLKQKEGHA